MKNNIKTRMSQILVRFGERQELGRMFRVSQPTVRRALSGKTRTELSMRIRQAALRRGGLEGVCVSKNDIPTL